MQRALEFPLAVAAIRIPILKPQKQIQRLCPYFAAASFYARLKALCWLFIENK
jgi:hypothetical protein